MNIENQSAYILEEEEFAVLLLAKGISSFQGFPLEHVPDTEEEIYQVLFGLTEKGFLTSDGKEFQAEKEIADCLNILEQARGLLLLIPEQEEFPQSFCYPGEQVLVCQPMAFKRGAVKLWKTSWENLGELIEENGRETKIQYYESNKDKVRQEIRFIREADGYLVKSNAGEVLILQKDTGNVLKNLTEDVE